MLKLNSSYSKKVPVEGQDFSSQSYHASVEVELPDGWEVRLAPSSVRVVTAVGSFVQDVVVGDGVVTVERTLEVIRSRVEPSEYEGFVRIRRSFSTSWSEPIVIAREVAH